jgi:DNA polymerase-3 subunit beta
MGSVMLVSRLIDGEYPDYERVIPRQNGVRLTMDTRRLLSASRRIATMANPRMPGMKMEAAGDVLRMSSSAPEFGEAYEEMRIRKEGDDVEIALNVRYVMDALRVMGAEETVMEIAAPLKPVLMKPAMDNGYLYVLMPMKL